MNTVQTAADDSILMPRNELVALMASLKMIDAQLHLIINQLQAVVPPVRSPECPPLAEQPCPPELPASPEGS